LPDNASEKYNDEVNYGDNDAGVDDLIRNLKRKIQRRINHFD
jgi:hypothetical protein